MASRAAFVSAVPPRAEMIVEHGGLFLEPFMINVIYSTSRLFQIM